MLNLLNNWFVQVILGNIAWNILCRIAKYLKNYFQQLNEHASQDPNQAKLYPIDLLKKQYNICSKLSSICIIIIIVILKNNLINSELFYLLFIACIIIIFFCYILMLGAFDGLLEYFKK